MVKVMLIKERLISKTKKKINNPTDIFRLMKRKSQRLDREYFWRVDLDAQNIPVGYEVVSIGTLNAGLCHPREIFKGAILNNSASIVLVHNHPSNNVEPSQEDIETTKRIIEAGKILGIEVFDHIIIYLNGFTSIREKNEEMFKLDIRSSISNVIF